MGSAARLLAGSLPAEELLLQLVARLSLRDPSLRRAGVRSDERHVARKFRDWSLRRDRTAARYNGLPLGTKTVDLNQGPRKES